MKLWWIIGIIQIKTDLSILDITWFELKNFDIIVVRMYFWFLNAIAYTE